MVAVLVLFCQAGLPQGTLQIGFEGPPYIGAPYPQAPGTAVTLGSYSESGMLFHNAFGPEGVALVGSGYSQHPDNGSAYLHSSGGWLRFGFSSGMHFNLAALDLAESFAGAATFQVVGYKDMGVQVTTNITTDGIMDGPGGLPDFQTVGFDSRFVNLYQIDILTDGWAIDNVMLRGVPEPTGGTLIVLGALSALGWSLVRRRRPSRGG